MWKPSEERCIHDDRSFGELSVRQNESGDFSVKYLSCQMILSPEKRTIALTGADDGRLPVFYYTERIGYPILRLISGYVLLHSGAIAVNGRCYAFVGLPETGKSTMTAASLAYIPGSVLMSDDMLAVCDQDKCLAVPSSRHLAMRHGLIDSALHVQCTVKTPYKTLLALDDDSCGSQCCPLDGIFVLSAGMEAGKIEKLSPASAMQDILRQQFQFSQPPASFAKWQFASVMQIIRKVPVFRLGISFKNRADIEYTVAQFLQYIACQPSF